VRAWGVYARRLDGWHVVLEFVGHIKMFMIHS